ASAISAALRMDCAATAALPLADNGRIRPALTLPSPILLEGCDGALGAEPKSGRLLEQPANKAMDASATHHGEEARAGREPRDLSPPKWGRGPRDDAKKCRRQPTRAIGILWVDGKQNKKKNDFFPPPGREEDAPLE